MINSRLSNFRSEIALLAQNRGKINAFELAIKIAFLNDVEALRFLTAYYPLETGSVLGLKPKLQLIKQ